MMDRILTEGTEKHLSDKLAAIDQTEVTGGSFIACMIPS